MPPAISWKASGSSSGSSRASEVKRPIVVSSDVRIFPSNLIPPHKVTSKDKLKEIMVSMINSGWIGRSVLAYDDGNGFHALTGSHRIEAAREVLSDTVIPVRLLDLTPPHFGAVSVSLSVAGDDEERLEILQTLHDRAAIGLMKDEIRRNLSDFFSRKRR
jgi:hypothetical protein